MAKDRVTQDMEMEGQIYDHHGPDHSGGHQCGYPGNYNHYDQDRREVRDHPQPQYQHRGDQGHYNQYQYGPRSGPIPTYNRYEALRV